MIWLGLTFEILDQKLQFKLNFCASVVKTIIEDQKLEVFSTYYLSKYLSKCSFT